MSDAFTIRLDDTAVLARLAEISRRVGNMAPAMKAIGEVLSESTKERFSTSLAPDGSRWAPNAQATVLGTLARIKGAYSKRDGRLTKKGATAAAGKRPLVDTGILQDSIRYQVSADGNSVEIGTNRFAGEWTGGAAVHQFGTTKAGRGRKTTIPARPFLGISAADRGEVLAILDRFLAQAAGQ